MWLDLDCITLSIILTKSDNQSRGADSDKAATRHAQDAQSGQLCSKSPATVSSSEPQAKASRGADSTRDTVDQADCRNQGTATILSEYVSELVSYVSKILLDGYVVSQATAAHATTASREKPGLILVFDQTQPTSALPQENALLKIQALELQVKTNEDSLITFKAKYEVKDVYHQRNND